MSKKPKKKKTEPFGQAVMEAAIEQRKAKADVKEPSFDELWEQTVGGIKTLEEDYSEEYWARAAKEKYAPLLFPRRKKEQLEYEEKLKAQGVRIPNAAGPPFQYGELYQKEVEGIYRSLMEERLLLYMRVKIKKTTKLKDISKEEKLLLDLPPYGPETWKKWCPLFISRFMKKYDGQPEQHTKFYENVNESIERKSEGRRKSLPSDSQYREAIKDKLEGVVKSYANQPYELRT